VLDKSPLAQPIWLGFFVFNIKYFYMRMRSKTAQQLEFISPQRDTAKKNKKKTLIMAFLPEPDFV